MEKKKPQTESFLDKKQRVIERFIKMSRILEQPDAGEETATEIEIALKDMSPEEKALQIYEYLVTYSLKRREHQKRKPAQEIRHNPRFISQFKQLWSDEKSRRIFLQKFGEVRFDLSEHNLSPLAKEIGNIESSILDARNRFQKLEQELNIGKITDPEDIKIALSERRLQQLRLRQLLDNEKRIVNLEGYEHIQSNTDVSAIVMYETFRRYQREIKEKNFAWMPSRWKIHERARAIMEGHGKKPLLIGPPGTGKTSQIGAIAREMTGLNALRIGCHSGLAEEGLVVIRDVMAGEGAYDYRGTLTEAATGFTHSQNSTREYEEGRFVFLDEAVQLDMDRALGPIKEAMDARPGTKFARLVPLFEVIEKEGANELDTTEARDLFLRLGGSEEEFEKLTKGLKKQKGRLLYRPTLPGFNLGATSNEPIKDERFDRHFGRISTNYFEMTPENPELYEFILAKLLREEGHLPLIDERDIKPAYQKQDIPEADRMKLQDGSTVIAMEKLVENPADARHGFLYRFAGAVRAIQDSYIHGSQFNEKHLANTAVYEDLDNNENVVIKGYVTNLADKSQFPGGRMLKLKSGSSTVTAEIVSKWTEGFSKSGEKDLTRWLQKMLQEHIDQTSPEDAERIRAIADYFHIFEEVQKRVTVEPLTPMEIGYLSPRVPRPLYVEKPAKAEEPEAQQNEQPVKQNLSEVYTTKKVVLENSETVIIRERDGNFQNVSNEMEDLKIGTRMIIDGKRLEFAGVVDDDTSNNNGKLIGRLIGEDLYIILDSKKIELGLAEEFLISSATDIEDSKEDIVSSAFV